MHFLALVPVVVGLLLAVVGFLGLRGRLTRERFGGVRTEATLRDDETFLLANKVAGLPVLAGGLIGVAGGAVGLGQPSLALVTGVVGTVGMLVIAAAGGLLGHRTALAMPAPKPELPAGCRGCACGGCDLARAVDPSVGANVAGVSGE